MVIRRINASKIQFQRQTGVFGGMETLFALCVGWCFQQYEQWRPTKRANVFWLCNNAANRIIDHMMKDAERRRVRLGAPCIQPRRYRQEDTFNDIPEFLFDTTRKISRRRDERSIGSRKLWNFAAFWLRGTGALTFEGTAIPIFDGEHIPGCSLSVTAT